MPRVQCSCGAAFDVSDALAGRAARCPRCRATIPVPPARPAAPASSPEPAGTAPPTILARCSCGAEIRAPAALAGRKVRCVKCKEPVRLPGAAAPRPTSPPPPRPAAKPEAPQSAAPEEEDRTERRKRLQAELARQTRARSIRNGGGLAAVVLLVGGIVAFKVLSGGEGGGILGIGAGDPPTRSEAVEAIKRHAMTNVAYGPDPRGEFIEIEMKPGAIRAVQVDVREIEDEPREGEEVYWAVEAGVTWTYAQPLPGQGTHNVSGMEYRLRKDSSGKWTATVGETPSPEDAADARYELALSTEEIDPSRAIGLLEGILEGDPEHEKTRAELARLQGSVLVAGGTSPEVEILASSDSDAHKIWQGEGLAARSAHGLVLPLPPGRYAVIVRRRLSIRDAHFYMDAGFGPQHIQSVEFFTWDHEYFSTTESSFAAGTCPGCRRTLPRDLLHGATPPEGSSIVGSLGELEMTIGIQYAGVEKREGQAAVLEVWLPELLASSSGPAGGR